MARAKKHETFLYRVYKKTRPTQKGCFKFYGHLNQDGYGRINKDGKLVFIHRELYKMFKGEVSDEMCVCHTCDNPCCVNLNHLFLGTHTDNMKDRKKKGRYTQKGDTSPSRKLYSTDIPIIRMRIRNGDPCYHIAKDYGVTGEAILAIKHNKTWKHV